VLSPPVVLLAACRLPDPSAWDDESKARIAADRPEISFPTVDVGDDEPVVQRLTVKDVGSDPLTVYATNLELGRDFRVVDSLPVTLDPGATFAYDIEFDPRTAFEHEDVFVVESDDPEHPMLGIPLHGVGLAPVLEVDPGTLDFGMTYVGCDIARGIVIGNKGNDLLIVQVPSFESSSPELELDASGYPLEVGPGDVATIEVGYRPLDEASDAAIVTIASNDPFASGVMVDVTADARLADTHRDSFVQPLAPMTDVVFVVDDANTMALEQSQLAADIGSFVSSLDALGVDYRIAVITTQDAGLRGAVVTPATANASSVLAEQVVPDVTIGASRGLQMLATCVSGGDCDGFVRPDALLTGIVVSDRSDSSALAPEKYVEQLVALKGAASLVRIHAIAGAVPVPSCSTCDSAGFGLDQAQELTGGTFLDICTTDWGKSLAILAAGSISEVASFPLQLDPVVDTIVVEVDGTEWSGWTYTGHADDGGTNEVRFDGVPTPPGGSSVDISYVVTGPCH
jgi:hypothetical protein